MRWFEFKNGFFFPLIFHHCFFWGANILFFYLWKRILGFEMLRPDFKTNFVWWQVFSLVVQYLGKREQASCFQTFNFVPGFMWLCPSHFWRCERTAIRVPVEKLPLSSYPQGRQDLCVKSSQCLTSSWETHRVLKKFKEVHSSLPSKLGCVIFSLLFPIGWIQNNQDSLHLSLWRETANMDA